MKDITPRQFYAAQAMNAFLTNANTAREDFIKSIAANAFKVADAMLDAEGADEDGYTHPTGVLSARGSRYSDNEDGDIDRY